MATESLPLSWIIADLATLGLAVLLAGLLAVIIRLICTEVRGGADMRTIPDWCATLKPLHAGQASKVILATIDNGICDNTERREALAKALTAWAMLTATEVEQNLSGSAS